jgi:hypothetical protein
VAHDLVAKPLTLWRIMRILAHAALGEFCDEKISAPDLDIGREQRSDSFGLAEPGTVAPA